MYSEASTKPKAFVISMDKHSKTFQEPTLESLAQAAISAMPVPTRYDSDNESTVSKIILNIYFCLQSVLI